MDFENIRIPHITSEIFDADIDSYGFLWLGKVDGLYRYNGHRFEQFRNNPEDLNSVVPGRPVNIFAGAHNDLWIGSFTAGVSRLDIRTLKFNSFRNIYNDSASIGGNRIGDIFSDEEDIAWIGSDDFCLNKLHWKSGIVQRYYPPADTFTRAHSNYLGKIVADKLDKNILWVGAPHGVYRFEKSTGNFQLFPFVAYNINYKPYPIAIYPDSSGIIWASSSLKETTNLVRIDPIKNIIRRIPFMEKKANIRAGYVTSEIRYFAKNEIIIITRLEGPIIYHIKHDTIRKLLSNSIKFTGANFFVRDSIGNTWTSGGVVGRGGSDLLRSPPSLGKSKTYKFSGIVGENWSRAFLKDPKNGNKLWIGTLQGGGLLEVDFDHMTTIAHSYSIDMESGRDVFMGDLDWVNDTEMAIATEKGLLIFDQKSGKIGRIGDQQKVHSWENITTVCSCNDEIWFSEQNKGLFAVDTSFHRLKSKINFHEMITELGCYKNTLLVGSIHGLYSVDLSTKQKELIMTIPNAHVSQIVPSDTGVWISTLTDGMIHLKENLQSWEFFKNKDARGTNVVYDFSDAKNGQLWLNSDGGTILFDPIANRFTNLIEMGIGKRSPILELDNGYIVSGIFAALRYFLPNNFLARGLPPKLYFTKINIANREEGLFNTLNDSSIIKLKPREKEIELEFDAINYNVLPLTYFEYRLIGNDEEWQSIGTRRYLNFHNLTPGNYTLEMRGLNAYGGYSKRNISLDILVLPTIWQKGWFRALLAFGLIGFAFFGYKIWSNRKQKQSHEDIVEYFANSRYAKNSVDEILWDVARNAISRLGFEDCVVYMLDPKQNTFIQKAAYGIKNPLEHEIANPISIPFGEGIVGHAALIKKPLIINDTSNDERYILDITRAGSELAVPIVYQGMVIGVIDSEHSKKGFYTAAHANVLEKIAKECAHKIANAQAAEEIEKGERSLLNIEKEVAELKLTALQAQMNPHFIFNSLNSINYYILKNKPKEASIYLTKFSKLVRLILNNSKNLSIPLDQEINSLKLYLDLEAMRFENTFSYEIQTDESIDLEEVFIPPLILQPFVENAIWHGLMHKKTKGHLFIQIYPEGNQLKCIVQDDGVGRRVSQRLNKGDATQHKSKGIKLTTDRIQLMHKDFLAKNMIRIIDLVDAHGEAAGTRVEVQLPYEED